MKINKANNNNSASIIIPKKALEKLGWKIGNDCKMIIDKHKLIIELKSETIFN